MKLRKPAYASVIFAVVLFMNPCFNAFDFLPDFIGAFILAALLSRAADVVPYLAEARDAFVRLGIISLVRLPAAVIMFTNLHTGMDIVPLFTLVFAVLELIFLYPAVLNSARGLYYLAERSDAVGIVKPLRIAGISLPAESVRGLTLVFLTIRAVCNFLPQICHLTFPTERANYIASRLYAPLELGGMALVLVAGILWAIPCITYTLAVKKHGGIADGIEKMAGEERLEKLRSDAGIRAKLRSLVWFAVSGAFVLDVSLLETNGFNILPHFIFIILALIAVYKLSSSKRTRLMLLLSGILAAIASTASFILMRSFSDEFSVQDIARYTVANEAFARVEILAIVEALTILAFILTLALSLREFIHAHTGVSPDSDRYGISDAKYHRELCKKVYVLLTILAITFLLKSVNILSIGSPVEIPTDVGPVYSARFPWLSTVILGLDLFYILRSIWVVHDLRDEVKYKYEL